MRSRQATYLRFVITFAILGGLGLVASVYTLVHQRLALPFTNSYSIQARFSATDGLVSGIGQPVNVVGVKVGQVTGVTLQDGSSLVTMTIDRGQLARVYANATAILQPITPLEDLQIDLSPGTSAGGLLRGPIQIGRSEVPVPLSDLLDSLDTDTRQYLSSLITSLGQGLAGRGVDLNRALAALGPTAADVHTLASAIATRDHALSGLVHNVAVITHAASQDRQLSQLVNAGDQTVHALAVEQQPLRAAIAEFPQTLGVARATLTALEPFAERLEPTLKALQPALTRLPATLRAIPRFADAAASAISHGLRPFVNAALPVARQLAPATTGLVAAVPSLTDGFQALRYFVNELAYNPGGTNQGYLFWLDWVGHNIDTFASEADAHGPLAKVSVLSTCYGLQDVPKLSTILGLAGLCSK